ncbi:FecR domain-containing protein [Chitinophaga horti]|uniref:FecR domain-containing protein n=1 Tax=Chitinophaga horti TaxID=2920382 RepID=A0ABY6IY33_9BACT|nr:FecR domain-containing protein [Chitinophaga horti]UYQ92116.1 FecR domain-containing protein [Chitinophaga horti]
MTPKDYSIEEILEHPSFRLWVLEQDEAATSYWEQWMSDHPALRVRVMQAREVLLLIGKQGVQAKTGDASEVWQRISHSIDSGNGHIPAELSVARKGFRRAYAYAAVIAVVIVAAFAAFIFYPAGKSTFSTAMGEMKTVVLPDSSVVRLNVNSSISYGKNWDGQSDREVWINGEAFFTVMHKNNNQHFLVHTNDVDIQVVGTEFNVNTRRVKTQVVLNTGVVKLTLNGDKVPASHQTTPITMKPGDMIVYSAATAELATKRVNPEEYSSWRTNVLNFHDTPIAEVIKTLHDNMGVTINLQDTALNGQTFTGSIPMDNIGVFFKTLARSFEIKISKTGEDTYEISQQ